MQRDITRSNENIYVHGEFGCYNNKFTVLQIKNVIANTITHTLNASGMRTYWCNTYDTQSVLLFGDT